MHRREIDAGRRAELWIRARNRSKLQVNPGRWGCCACGVVASEDGGVRGRDLISATSIYHVA